MNYKEKVEKSIKQINELEIFEYVLSVESSKYEKRLHFKYLESELKPFWLAFENYKEIWIFLVGMSRGAATVIPF